MKRVLQFEEQLKNFGDEASLIARYVYAEMAIQYAIAQSPELLRRLNRTPMFWMLCGASLQTSAYLALGRVFDTKSKYTLDALLSTMEADLSVFSPAALEARKLEGRSERPVWIDDYLISAYRPSSKDVARLRAKVQPFRALYERAVKPPRHKYLAHREKLEKEEVQALFGQATAKDLWLLTTFLLQFHEQLWQLLHNGRKPRFGRIRYSIKSLYERPSGSRPHEQIVREVRALMESILRAGPNNSSTPMPLCAP